jgi:tetratricopeptide (TPR) repeat protein
LALHNLAEIDVQIGAPQNDVQKNIDLAKSIFSRIGYVGPVIWCDVLQAELNLREGDLLGANTLLQRSIRISWGKDSENVANCLEKLGNISRWGSMHGMSSWTTVFLANSLKSKQKLGIHKALKFLGDASLADGDGDTAVSLFTIALEGFTHMDVHRSRAECMLQLGDISKGYGDLLKAVELWTAAKPLFERSSQVKEVEKINERLAVVNNDVLEQHRNNLALAELNAPSGIVQELEDAS